MKPIHLNRLARETSIEKSLDAAIEVELVLQKRATVAPSLRAFAELMLGTSSGHQLSKKELLGNPQVANIYRTATGQSENAQNGELDRLLQLFKEVCEVGVSNFSKIDLEFIRDFCLGTNRLLLDEAYARIVMPPNRNERASIDGHRAWA